MNHKAKILLLLVLFFAPIFASASSVSINEIMYDAPGTDTGHEWIEIYNSSSSSVDVSTWKFFEEGSNHGLTSASGGASIPSGGFAIITSDPVKFSEDFPSYSGILIDSSWSSFNNVGESLALKDGGGSIVNQVDYVGGSIAVGDGNTLQLVSGSWVSGAPTPGSENSGSGSGNNDEENNDEENNSVITQSDDEEVLKKIYNGMVAKVEMESNAVVGVPNKFKVKIYDEYGRQSMVGYFVWNFGDGVTTDQKDILEFEHIYKKVGKYVAYLDYFKRNRTNIPDASIKVIVNVIEPGLVISSIDSSGNIEIKNEGTSDRDISGWVMNSLGQIFVLPSRSIIMSKSSMFVNSLAHQFPNLNPYSKLDLYLPTGEHYLTFPKVAETPKVIQTSSPVNIVKSSTIKTALEEEITEPEIVIEPKSQTSSVVLSLEEEKSGINPKLFIGAFVLFCLIVMFAFYRFNKHKPESGNDADEYKILS